MNMSERTIFFAAFTLRDFFAVDDHVARRFDADANLRSIHRHHGDFNVVANSKGFASASGKYQHGCIYACYEIVTCEHFLRVNVGLRRPCGEARDGWNSRVHVRD
jgi:hypothetical protein